VTLNYGQVKGTHDELFVKAQGTLIITKRRFSAGICPYFNERQGFYRKKQIERIAFKVLMKEGNSEGYLLF
jgi:hypothetical protein